MTKLSNEKLADRLETMYVPNGGDFLDQAASDRLQAIKFREAAKRLRNIPNCEDCQITAELRELLIGCSPVTGTFKTPEELTSHLKSLK